MFSKLYAKTKCYIKENYKVLLFILVCFLLLTVRLPYYVSAPGGLINAGDKIKNSSFKMKGSLNMAYVSQIEGTVPILLYSLINPNWDIESLDEVTVGNESIKDEEYRNKMFLKEGNSTALLVAYDYSGVKYKVENNKVFVTYKDDLANTNLKVGDQFLKVEDRIVTQKQDLFEAISNKKINDKITFTVLRDGKKKKCEATLINVKGEARIGLIITETLDINSDNYVDLKFNDSESGSSGGLMMTLAIYSYLNKIDLTAGKKIVGTGTIERNGTVGQISGIKYKLIGAVKKKADIFLVPKGENYDEALKLKKEKGYKIKLVPVSNFEDALNYLKNL